MALLRLRNIIAAFLLILIAFIFQHSILGNIGTLEVGPNLVLIIVFVYGYVGGKISGMTAGFFAGIITDIFFCEVIGFYAALYLLVGYFSGLMNKYYYSNNISLPIVFLIVSDLACGIIYYIVWFVFRSRFIFGYALAHSIIPECILTALFGLALYIPLARLNRYLAIKD